MRETGWWRTPPVQDLQPRRGRLLQRSTTPTLLHSVRPDSRTTTRTRTKLIV